MLTIDEVERMYAEAVKCGLFSALFQRMPAGNNGMSEGGQTDCLRVKNQTRDPPNTSKKAKYYTRKKHQLLRDMCDTPAMKMWRQKNALGHPPP
jgi:hypothetical protein